MPKNNVWREAWRQPDAEAEKRAEAEAFDAWQAQRLDESRDDPEPEPRVYRHRRARVSEPDYADDDLNEEPWPPSPEAKMRQFFLWRWLSKFVPKGYGTYAAVAAWIVINILAAAGYQIPGFDVVEGNEGAGINLGLAIAYLRRALG